MGEGKTTDSKIHRLTPSPPAVVRTYSHGKWRFNIEQPRLTVGNLSEIGGANVPDSLMADGAVYKRADEAGGVYKYGPEKIYVLTNGYKRVYGNGRWHFYNKDSGLMDAYGDRNDRKVLLSYDGSDRVTGMSDTFSNQVIWINYVGSNMIPSAVSNNAGQHVEYSYSTNGLLTNVVSNLKGQTTFEYNTADNRLTDRVDLATGHESHVTYDTYGRVLRIRNEAGEGWDYEYNYDKARERYYAMIKNTDGKVVEQWFDFTGVQLQESVNGSPTEEAVSDSTVYEKDINGNVTRIVNPDGTEIRREYDTMLNLMTKEVTVTGITNRFAYDAKGNLTNEVRYAGTALEKTSAYVYDSFGQLLSRSERGAGSSGAARVTEYLYDARGNAVSITVPDGTITTNTYNLLGNLLTSAALTTNNYQRTTVSNVYDVAGNLLMSFDAANRMAQSNQYDAVGNRTLSLDVSGRPTRYGYDFSGRATSVSNWLGEVVTRTYDFEGRVLRENKSKAEGLASKVYTYDDRGNLIQKKRIIHNSESITYYEYDLKNQLIKITDPSGSTVETVYNDKGLMVTETRTTDNRSLITEYSYDLRGRVLTQRVSVSGDSASLRETSYSYDAFGNVSTVTDPLGRTTGTEYDLLGRTAAVVDALNHTNSFQYDAWGSLTNLVDASGNKTAFEYDEAGRLKKKTCADSTSQQYFYDGFGRLERGIDAKNQKITYAYDTLDQLRTNRFFATSGSTAPEKTVVYTYDDYGRMLASSLRSQACTNAYTFVYDDVNRTKTVTVDFGPFSKTYTYQYDGNSRKSALIRDQLTTSYSYDAQGRLASIGIPNEGTVTYGYNAAGLLNGITLPGGAEQSFGYDAFSALVTNTVRDPAANAVLNHEYIRNAVQNIVGRNTEHGNYTYGYDNTDQLASEQFSNQQSAIENRQFIYDAMGNRLISRESTQGAQKEETYGVNNLNQYTTISNSLLSAPCTLLYDANGNTTQKVSVASGTTSVVNYAYSTDNRLVGVQIATNLQVSGFTVQASYSYDPFGRRISKAVVQNNTTNTTYYLYADEGLVGEFDDSGNEIRSYIWKPGSLWMNDPVCMILPPQAPSSQPQAFFYLNDHLGAPQRMVDGSGALVWSMTSEAFGKATVASGSTIVNNLRFSSQYYDEETGLHYNHFRYYDLGAGRYLGLDPIGEAGGINRYNFLLNSPLFSVDLLGLQSIWDPTPPGRGAGDTRSTPWKLIREIEIPLPAEEFSTGIFPSGSSGSGCPCKKTFYCQRYVALADKTDYRRVYQRTTVEYEEDGFPFPNMPGIPMPGDNPLDWLILIGQFFDRWYVNSEYSTYTENKLTRQIQYTNFRWKPKGNPFVCGSGSCSGPGPVPKPPTNNFGTIPGDSQEEVLNEWITNYQRHGLFGRRK